MIQHKELFNDFFKTYGEFLTYDAYYSLSYAGRDRDLISQFFHCFSTLLNKKPGKAEKKKHLSETFKYFTQYKKNKKIQIKYCESYEPDIENFSSILVKKNMNEQFIEAFQYFYISASSYNTYKKKSDKENIENLYIKNVQDYFTKFYANPAPSKDSIKEMIHSCKGSPVIRTVGALKQSLMEFNNALSHLHTAMLSKSDEVIIKNIERSIGHLHRASLDFYKAIIKDAQYLQKMDNKQIDKIYNVRKLEYKTIGKNHADRQAIILWYQDIVDSINNSKNL